jgi:ribonuclease HI
MKEVVIYSDGACKGNPGPGGWAAILRYNGAEREISGGVPATTNNRMELQAAIEALRTLKEPCKIYFYTDSAYLQNGVTKWIQQWITRSWLTKGSTSVRNQELWQELHRLTEPHTVVWRWIRGHSKIRDNSRCDRLARLEIANINRTFNDRVLKDKLADFIRENWPTSVPDSKLPLT